jgi:hypothetical protein
MKPDCRYAPAKVRPFGGVARRGAQFGALIVRLRVAPRLEFAGDLPSPVQIPPPGYLPSACNRTALYVRDDLGRGWCGRSDNNSDFSDALGGTLSAQTAVAQSFRN